MSTWSIVFLASAFLVYSCAATSKLESSRSRAIRLHSNVDHLGDGAVQRRVQRAAAAAAVNNKTDAPASHLAKNATKAAGISVASTSPGTITTSVYYLLPRNYFSKPIKSGAMAMVVVVVVLAFLYIAFSSWKSRRRQRHLRTYRGSREKMEMAPMAKHADDLEDDTIFDMGKSDVV